MKPYCGDSAALKRLPPFSWMRDTQLTWALPALRCRTYPARAYIQRAGDAADGLYVLLSGKVRLVHEDRHGHQLVAGAIGPNDFFGELGLFDGSPCAVSIQTESPCEVVFVPVDVVVDCLEDNAHAAMAMLRKTVARLCEAHRKMASVALTGVYDRVVEVILEHSAEAGGEWPVRIGSECIAELVGASREMVSRVVRDMVKQGLVRRHKRRLVIVDRAALQRRGREEKALGPAAA